MAEPGQANNENSLEFQRRCDEYLKHLNDQLSSCEALGTKGASRKREKLLADLRRTVDYFTNNPAELAQFLLGKNRISAPEGEVEVEDFEGGQGIRRQGITNIGLVEEAILNEIEEQGAIAHVMGKLEAQGKLTGTKS